MVSFVKSVTFDCAEPLRVAAFWADALGSSVDEDSTQDKAWVEPAGWGGPSLWFQRVPEGKAAKMESKVHNAIGGFDLRVVGDVPSEVRRLTDLGARLLRDDHGQIVMADPEGNEFCVES